MSKTLENTEITLELDSMLGVKKTFFNDLLKEDDWSFIIKLHALFEAVCTHLLLYHFKEPELSDIFNRLELSSQSTGKIVFLERLGFIGKEKRRFIVTLSELRNDLVHNVHNCEFSLDKMIQSYDSKALKEFAISFSPIESMLRRAEKNPKLKLKLPGNMQVDSLIKRAKSNPKFHIWFGAFQVLSSILEMYGYSDYKQWVKAKKVLEEE
jgi:hypothetical protein